MCSLKNDFILLNSNHRAERVFLESNYGYRQLPSPGSNVPLGQQSP
jgi:hypothetical protein